MPAFLQAFSILNVPWYDPRGVTFKIVLIEATGSTEIAVSINIVPIVP